MKEPTWKEGQPDWYAPVESNIHAHSGSDQAKITSTQILIRQFDLSNISATAPINFNSGTGVISLNDSGVTPGTYNSVTVSVKGIVTAGSSVPVAPVNAQFLTLATDATLTDERVFTPSANFTVVDGGAGGTYTIDLSTVVAASTYNQVTVDNKGRVIAGSLVVNSYYDALIGTDSTTANALAASTIRFLSNNGVVVSVADASPDTATISTPQDIRTSASPTFAALTLTSPLTTANGGTGLASYTQGDLIYYDTGTTFTKLTKNTTATRYLSNTGTSNNPAWAQVSLTNGITGTLGATNGGTGQSTVTTGDLLYGSATDTWSKLAGVAAGSYLRSGGVTTAPLWSTLILPNSATANRVPYATSTNTWGESANMTFDGNKFSLAAATSAANGLRLGTTVDLYNDTTDRLRINDRLTSVTSFTATSGSWVGINSSATGTPAGATSSARMWGLQFFADATGIESWSASNGGIMGLEGFARNSGSGTVTTALGATAYVNKASTGAITTAKAYTGWVQNNDTTNDIGTAIVYHADTFINTGHVTSWTGLLTGGPAFSANSQTRFGISISAMPNPGAFASTTVFAINIAGTSTTGRDGIRFGADSSAVVYRSASATVATIAAFTVGTNLTVTGGSATLSTVLGAVDAGGATSFEIPNGAGGTTVDATGELTVDSTSRTLNFYDGTAEVVLDPLIAKAFYLPLPASSDDLPLIRFDRAATLVKVVYAISGGTNWVGQLQEADDAQGTGAADTQAADSTVTGNTTVTSFSNASFDAGDYARLKTTSVSGVVTWLHVTFYYRMNP